MAGNIYENGVYLGPTGDPNNYVESTTSAFALGQLGKVVAIPFKTNMEATTGDFDIGQTPRTIQIVQRKTNASEDALTSTDNLRPGAVAYWQDPEKFVVCFNTENAVGQTNGPKSVAGVFLGDYAVSTTSPVQANAGKLCAIQVGGIAPIRVYGSVATTTIGYPLVSAVTEGFAAVRYVLATTANDTLAVYPEIGYVLSSTTVATGGAAWVKAMLELPVVGR
jgi:hypothetical protein